MNLTVPISMRLASAVITVSASSRRDILSSYHLSEEKVFAIDNGVDCAFRPAATPDEEEEDRAFVHAQYGIDAPFILAVGVLQPRKNLARLAAAFGELCRRGDRSTVLVFTGKAGWLTGREELKMAASAIGGSNAAERVVFTGYVPDDDLPRLMRASSTFGFPSLFEGFGLPALEAMASGTPTVCADAPAMNDLVQDGALLVSPQSTKDWADALLSVLTDNGLRSRLSIRGPEIAARYTWERAAQQTIEAYTHALNRYQGHNS